MNGAVTGRGPRVELYDTTLRDGAQAPGLSYSVEDRMRILRKLDQLGLPFIEGGWPGANPRDTEFFRLAAKETLEHAELVAFGMTRRAGEKAEDSAILRDLLDAGTETGHVRGQELGRPRREGAADRSRRRRRDGPGHGPPPPCAGTPRVLRCRALLRRLPRERRLRHPRARSRGRGGRRAARALRHERRHAPVGRHAHRGGGPRAGGRRPARDPHPQRRRLRGGLRPRRRRGRRPPGPGRRERLRRADRQRRHRADRREPRAEDGRRLPARGRGRAPDRSGALRRGGRQRRAGFAAAVRGPLRVHPQGGAARERRRPVQRGVRARLAGRRGQPARRRRLRPRRRRDPEDEGRRVRPRDRRRGRSRWSSSS